jgi:hypothetical protein
VNNKDFGFGCKGIAIVGKVVYSLPMYDLDQDQYRHEKPKKKSHLPIIFGICAFLIFCIVTGIIFIPKIRQAIYDSNVVQLISDSESPRTQPAQSARICFLIRSSESVSFRQIDIKLRKAPTTAHAVLEALLAGPPSGSELETLIPKRTKLIGVTITNNYAFVNLSSQFASDPDTTFLAAAQVRTTLRNAYQSLEKIIIMADGEPLSL